jgi:hypothetical protein
MSIDLGNNPVGSAPTDEQKTQLRSSIGLGSSDTVEFGALVAPSGTTAEIDTITNATVGQVVIDTDRNKQVLFTGSSTYIVLGHPASAIYYVDPQNGDDSSGRIGGRPFATIQAALAKGIADDPDTITIKCLKGTYSEVDAFGSLASTREVSISFDEGCLYSNSSQSDYFINNASGSIFVTSINGRLNFTSSLAFGFYTSGIPTSVDTIISLGSVATPPTSNPFISIAGNQGKVTINVEGSYGRTNSLVTIAPFVSNSGSGEVEVNSLNYFAGAPVFAAVSPATLLSGTGKLVLNNVSAQHGGLCEITSNTTCTLVVKDCKCSEGGLAGTSLTVKAPSGSSNPKAFAFGSNAVPKAATNITVDTTFGSFTVDAKAEELF